MIKEILDKLDNGSVKFADVIAYIESEYIHIGTAFKNGSQENAANQNQGSAKVFAFAKLNGLTKQETLKLFAEHYQLVLETPDGEDHQNIRQFILNGWGGIKFYGDVLISKQDA